jgi:WD40 repeat protein
MNNGSIVVKLYGHGSPVMDLVMNHVNGFLISTGYNDNIIRAWNLTSRTCVLTSTQSTPNINALVVLITGEIVAGSSVLHMWTSSLTYEGNWTAGYTGNTVMSLTVFPDGVTVALGTSSGGIMIFYSVSQKITTLAVYQRTGVVKAMTWTPLPTSVNYFVSGTSTFYVDLWYADGFSQGLVKSFQFNASIQSLYFLYSQASNCEFFSIKLHTKFDYFNKEKFIFKVSQVNTFSYGSGMYSCGITEEVPLTTVFFNTFPGCSYDANCGGYHDALTKISYVSSTGQTTYDYYVNRTMCDPCTGVTKFVNMSYNMIGNLISLTVAFLFIFLLHKRPKIKNLKIEKRPAVCFSINYKKRSVISFRILLSF